MIERIKIHEDDFLVYYKNGFCFLLNAEMLASELMTYGQIYKANDTKLLKLRTVLKWKYGVKFEEVF